MHLWNFWNFSSKTKAISKFLKITRVIYPKKCPSQACGYWLITPNQQSLCIETNIFFNSRQLQNTFVNGAILITISCVIRDRDILGETGQKTPNDRLGHMKSNWISSTPHFTSKKALLNWKGHARFQVFYFRVFRAIGQFQKTGS